MAVAKRAALRAEHRFRHNMAALNARRAADGVAVTTAHVGLHVGEVFYGNIGSEDRLDFTVVGPAVNEVSRIASMCRSVDRELLTSQAFRTGLDAAGRNYLVSTGRFALRGISRAQDLYTLDPDIARMRSWPENTSAISRASLLWRAACRARPPPAKTPSAPRRARTSPHARSSPRARRRSPPSSSARSRPARRPHRPSRRTGRAPARCPRD